MPAAEAQPPVAPLAPDERQILANIGNRYVVFGSQVRMHRQPLLGPEDVRTHFAERVGDELDFPAERLIGSIQVAGAEVRCTPPQEAETSDLQVTFANGATILVDVKVGTRDFKGDELQRHWTHIREANRTVGAPHEVWSFNIDRLKLMVLFVEEGMAGFSELDALRVWEFNPDGPVFDRTILDEHLDHWERRIAEVYALAEEWGAREGLTADRSRRIVMSEELMRKFAVPDRELAILDLNRGDAPVMSIVPAGLWVFGSRGRIDIITQDRSIILLDISRDVGATNWVYYVRGEKRDLRPWDEAAFRSLVGAEAHA